MNSRILVGLTRRSLIQASRYALGVGGGVVQPSSGPSAQVNIGIQAAGYVIDLQEPNDGAVVRLVPGAGPVIEGEATELDDDVK